MPSPLPAHPRGPRRKRVVRETLLFGCPRVAPDWELAALRALMKPQTRGAIQNKPALQKWPAGAPGAIRKACDATRERIGYGPTLQFPQAGDFYFTVTVAEASVEDARGFALVVSTRLPALWFVFGKLFVRAGEFYRRERGYGLTLVPATNVHLTRAVRGALRDLL